MGEHFRVKHGYAFKGEYFDSEGQYVLLTPGSFIEEGGYREQGKKTKFYTGDIPESYVLDEGDLLVAMTEQTPGLLGSSAWIPESGRLLHNQRLGRIVDLDEHRLSKRFLYYLFNTKEVRDQISATATGGKVRHTAPERIAQVLFRRPPLGTQQSIAAALSAYDDLIENNRRRMALLEEAARHLYCEWFVRLRFPGHEHTRITNGVPEGWARRSFVQTCSSLEDGDWIETKDQGGEDYRLLQISNIGVNEFIETGNLRYVTEETFKRLNCREILSEHVLIARMPDPIGRAWLVTDMPWRMITAVDVAIAIANEGVADAYFLTYFLNSPTTLEQCKRLAVGATRPRIARRELASLPLLLPQHQLQLHFREYVEPLHKQRAVLHRQIEKLRTARNLLLPRLMNGAISV